MLLKSNWGSHPVKQQHLVLEFKYVLIQFIFLNIFFFFRISWKYILSCTLLMGRRKWIWKNHFELSGVHKNEAILYFLLPYFYMLDHFACGLNKSWKENSYHSSICVLHIFDIQRTCFTFILGFPPQLYWGIIDKYNFTYLKCTIRWFDIHIYHWMITKFKVINTVISSHS